MIINFRLRPFYAPDGVVKPGTVFNGPEGENNKTSSSNNTSDTDDDNSKLNRDTYIPGQGKTDVEAIVSGIPKFGVDWSGSEDASGTIGKSRGQTQGEEVASFDPKINHDWTYPGYKEDKEKVEALGQKYKDLNYKRAGLDDNPTTRTDESKWHDYTKGSSSFRQKLAARRKAKEEAKKENESKKASVKDKAAERINKEYAEYKDKIKQDYLKIWKKKYSTPESIEDFTEEKKEHIYNSQEFKDYEKMKLQEFQNKYAFDWFKNTAMKGSDVKDEKLTSEEKKEAKLKLTDVLKKQEKAIEKLEKDPKYKQEQKEIQQAKDAWRAARKEMAKKQAPYAIRNAFLIIDMIQKSLQNIGRAMPQTKYSPAYTKTPMEEPELFKLWRDQIEKAQERTQKTESAVSDVKYANAYNKNALPSDTVAHQRNREEMWADKAMQLGFDKAAQKVFVDTMRETANYAADTIDEQDMVDLATYAAAKQAGDGNIIEAIESKWIAKHLDSVMKAARILKAGGVARDVTVGVLEQVGKSAALAAVTGGIANDVIKSIAEGLKSLPPFGEMTARQIASWIFSIAGGPDQAQKFIEQLNKTNTSKLKAKTKALENAANDEAKAYEKYVKYKDKDVELESEINSYMKQIADNNDPNSPDYNRLTARRKQDLERLIASKSDERTRNNDKLMDAKAKYDASVEKRDTLNKELQNEIYPSSETE